jgi:hypothetical protein
LTRTRKAGVVLDASDEPASFFGRRRRVLGAAIDGGEPMTMLLACGVLGVVEEERDDDNTGASILCGFQCHCGIVSRGLLHAAMWSRTKARVRPGTLHHNFRPSTFLLAGEGPLPSHFASSWLRQFMKNVVHWSFLSGS